MPSFERKYGGVGEDHVDARFGNGGEDLQTVALIDLQVMLRVVEGGLGELVGFGGGTLDGKLRKL
jgi:hypothetical protein